MVLGRTEDTERSEDTRSHRLPLALVLRGIRPRAREVWTLESSLVVGRGEDCGSVLDYSRVSRRHAEIYRDGPIFALRDMGSTNGTFVDGRRLEHCALRPGSVIRIGDWLGMVHPAEEGSATFRELAPGVFGGATLANAFAPLGRAAPTALPIVLVGDTGTGKERFAHAVHVLSGRTGPFHAINCAALPPTTAEAELFGYERGAFTGADRAFAGQLRAAHGGTLFLDEVAQLPLVLQAKLLRALELREVTPLGSVRSVSFDARVLSASQRPLPELVAEGVFREDLAARLDGLSVSIPALSERRDDIPSLFSHFLEQHSGGRPPQVTTKLYESLCLYPWPANVREIELLARRLLATHGLEPVLRRSHLPSKFRVVENGAEGARSSGPPESRNTHDHRLLSEALKQNGGNVKLAAKSVGISRQRAYRVIKAHGAPPDTDAGIRSNGSGSRNRTD